MDWDVTEVHVIEHLVLFVRFADDTQGQVRFLPSHLSGVFESLKDPAFFDRVFIDHGVVTWPNELDLAPDAMHDAIKKHGEWILS